MLEIPYEQIKSKTEKAVFYLGYLWECSVDTGIISPRRVELFGDKEDATYDDYVKVFNELKAIIEKRHFSPYREVVQFVEENLSNDEEYGVRHATFYVLGCLYASNQKGEMITASEANERWGLPEGEVRQSINRGKLNGYIGTGLVRQSGKVWLVSEQAMKEVYGDRE